jgi:hypothetical protein
VTGGVLARLPPGARMLHARLTGGF